MSSESNGDDETGEPMSIRRRTLAIEEERLRIEKRHVRNQLFTAGVPMLALAASILYGAWTLERQAQLGFELEVAKAIMQSPSPADAVGRAKFYAKAFPRRVPNDFAAQVDSKKYQGLPTGRMEFIKTVASRGLTPRQTAELWSSVFGRDEFARSPRVLAVLDGIGPTPAQADEDSSR